MAKTVCPECGSASIKDYKFGGYWCTTCLAWFTSKEFKDHVESSRTLIDVEVKPKVKA